MSAVQQVLLAQGASGPPSSLVFEMDFEGPNGSTTFTENFGKSISVSGACQISTAQFFQGTSSGFFPGGTADFLQCQFVSPDFDFGAGDFAIETDIRPTTVAGIHMLCTTRAGSGSDPGFLFWQVNNQIRFLCWGPTASTTLVDITGGTLTANTWARVRIQRVGTAFTLMQNGASVGSAVSGGTIVASPNTMQIGRDPSTFFREFGGYMDRFVIYKGGIS